MEKPRYIEEEYPANSVASLTKFCCNSNFVHLDISKNASPAITCDVRSGKYAEHIHVDSDLLTEYLRGRGFTDKEIAETNIQFVDRDCDSYPKYKNEDKNPIVGYFEKRTGDIKISIATCVDLASSSVSEYENQCGTLSKEEARLLEMEYASRECGATILHELRHREFMLRPEETETKEVERQKKKNINRHMRPPSIGLAIGSSYSIWGPQIMQTSSEYTDLLAQVGFSGALAISLAGLIAFIQEKRSGDDLTKRIYFTDPEEIACRKAEEHSAYKEIATILPKYAS